MQDRTPRFDDQRTRDRLARLGLGAATIDALLNLDSELYLAAQDTQRGAFVAHVLSGLTVSGARVQIEPAQFRALVAIARMIGAGEPATAGAVAQALQIDPSRASRLTAELVALGYLLRTADQQDGRRSLLEMTDKAAALFTAFVDRKWQYHLSAFAGWSDDDIATFARLYGRYRSKARALLDQPPLG